MFRKIGLRTGAVLVTVVAVAEIAYAAVAPGGGTRPVTAIEARAALAKAYAAATPSQIQSAVLQALKTKAGKTAVQGDALGGLKTSVGQKVVNTATDKAIKTKSNQTVLEADTVKALTAQADQSKVDAAVADILATKQNQTVIQTATLTALAATQNQAQVAAELAKQISTTDIQQELKGVTTSQGFLQQAELPNQLEQAATTNLLTQTLNLPSYLTQSQASAGYVQGQAKIITGQGTSSGTAVTVLTVPGLLHVSATWWPSDGTVQFDVSNDSGGTLDFGGDFTGVPYDDSFSALNQDFGTLTLPGADGTIASGASESFQITPRPDGVDKPSQEIPYRAEAHMQVTAPGSQIATLDLSAFEISQGLLGTGGSALASGQAVVGPA